jgi:membrane protein YdbS with pleckstrin-like domain
MPHAIEASTKRIYTGLWKVLVEFFRVPDEPPTLPVREGDFIHSFRPDEGFLRYLTCIFWIVLLATDIALTAGYITAAIALWLNDLWWVALLLLPPALVIIIVPDIIAWIAIHLRYHTTWYVMTERSLRIRRGIWVIRETTITFENVQNVKLQQGPLQRHFGIATLVVETAGAGAQHGKNQTMTANQGIIEGVSNAPELRDRILKRVRASTSAGLGDEEESTQALGGRSSSPAAAWTAEHLAVLREVRDALAARPT